MREIRIILRVEDDKYPEALELVARSLFYKSPWLPGFLFQSWISGYSLELDTPKRKERR